MDFFLRKSCISSVAARVTGNSPSAPASPTEEVDRWKVCTWSNCSDALSTPSSTACPVGVQFLPWKRGGSALRPSTATYCGMLLWSREHRSCLAMYIPSIDQLPRCGSRVLTVSFPSPAQPLNLCMICEEKNPLRFPLLCGFFHFFVHPSGPRLAATR